MSETIAIRWDTAAVVDSSGEAISAGPASAFERWVLPADAYPGRYTWTVYIGGVRIYSSSAWLGRGDTLTIPCPLIAEPA
jgi:hypothetical protein